MNRNRWSAAAAAKPEIWPIDEIQLTTLSGHLGCRIVLSADDICDCYDWLNKNGATGCELPSEGSTSDEDGDGIGDRSTSSIKKRNRALAITIVATEYQRVMRILSMSARWKHIRPLPAVLIELLQLSMEENKPLTKGGLIVSNLDGENKTIPPTHADADGKNKTIPATTTISPDEKKTTTTPTPNGEKKTTTAIPPPPSAHIPIEVWSQLKSYQRESVIRFVQLEGRMYLADDPGLGKTLQAIVCALAYRPKWPILIICPSSVKEGWRNEFCKWLAPLKFLPSNVKVIESELDASRTFGLVDGAASTLKKTRKRKTQNDSTAPALKKGKGCLPAKETKSNCGLDVKDVAKEEPFLVYVISYDLMIRPNVFRMLQAKQFKVMISDESHFLKNPTAKRTNCFISLANQCPHVIELSGTPGHSPALLYAPLRALQPNLMPPWWIPPSYSILTQEQWRQQEHKLPCSFAGRWADPRTEPTFGGKFAWVLNGGCRLEEFHSVLRQFCMLKRTKDEVLKDLPEKRRIPIYFEVPSHDRQVIQTELAAIKALRLNKPKEFKARFMRLFNDLPRVKSSGVMEYLTGIYATERQKSLWFAHHRAMIACLIQVCDALDLKYIVITGETSGPKRQVLVDQFQNDPTVQIAILSMTAAGFGLNLQAASLVIFAELFFGPDTMIQAEDRSHRLGQKAPYVECRYLIAKDTLDEGLLRMVNSKTISSALMIEGRHTTFAMRRAERLELSTDEDKQFLAKSSSNATRVDEPPVTQEELEQDALEVFQAQLEQLAN